MNVIARPLSIACAPLVIGAVLASLALPVASQTVVRPVERVVAVVNTEVITASRLASRTAIILRQLAVQKREAPPRDVLEKQVLERMIVEMAQSQRARELGIRVDDAQVDRAIEGIAADNRLTLAQMRERIERDGETFAGFREQVRGEIIRMRLREREVDAKVRLSDADVDAFMLMQDSASSAPPEFLLGQILLPVPEAAGAAEIERQRARGEELIGQLRGGAELARLVTTFKDTPDAPRGGSLDWRSGDRLPELFANAAAKLKVREVSALLRSGAGFHVLQLLDRRGGGAPGGAPIVQTHARHILIPVTNDVPQAEVLRRLADIKTRVQAGTGDFADLARQYSADGTAPNGGDLGWIYPGDTVPEFERAMSELAPGAISDAVRTTYGYHLIQVLERREEVASSERRRQAARQALRAQRIEEAYGSWLDQLRDSTYVEYRLESNQ